MRKVSTIYGITHLSSFVTNSIGRDDDPTKFTLGIDFDSWVAYLWMGFISVLSKNFVLEYCVGSLGWLVGFS